MQSKPSVWLRLSRLRAALTGPICRSALAMLTRTAVSPAAWSAGPVTRNPVSSGSIGGSFGVAGSISEL